MYSVESNLRKEVRAEVLYGLMDPWGSTLQREILTDSLGEYLTLGAYSSGLLRLIDFLGKERLWLRSFNPNRTLGKYLTLVTLNGSLRKYLTLGANSSGLLRLIGLLGKYLTPGSLNGFLGECLPLGK